MPWATSSQHPLQLLDPLQDLLLDRPQFRQDFHRWAVLHLFVYQFLVAIEAEVVTLLSDLRLGHAEVLGGAFPLALGILALAPAGQAVGQVVLVVISLGQGLLRGGAELLQRQQRVALVVEAPAVGGHVVEPHLIGTATAGLREK